MKSMTGYGKSVYSAEDYLIEFEIKSVNSRFLEIRLTLPRELTFMEIEINNMIKNRIVRGKISGRLNLISFESPDLLINETKLKAYKQIYDKIKQVTEIKDTIPLSVFLENEEIVIQNEDLSENKDLKEKIKKVITQAIDQHQSSALKEGESMQQFMNSSIDIMNNSLKAIENSFPEYKKNISNRMHDAASMLYKGKLTEEELSRLTLEIALYIEKADITEEVIRLKHHLVKFSEDLNHKKEVGKSLNFILQEMHREINTIGSKYNQNSIFDNLITIKEEIEKCREMVQNVV